MVAWGSWQQLSPSQCLPNMTCLGFSWLTDVSSVPSSTYSHTVADSSNNPVLPTELLSTIKRINLYSFCFHFDLCAKCVSRMMNCCPLTGAWATIRVLGMEPRSSARAVRALNHGAVSPAPLYLLNHRFIYLWTKRDVWEQVRRGATMTLKEQ